MVDVDKKVAPQLRRYPLGQRGQMMVHRRRVRIAALVAMSCWLVPQWTIGQIPVPDQFGKVLDAATDQPVAGVRVVAIDSGALSLDVGPRFSETVTDSLGKYTLSLWGQTWVLYLSPAYESLRMVYPEDFVDQDCGYCCGRVKDVRLQPLRK